MHWWFDIFCVVATVSRRHSVKFPWTKIGN